MPMIMFYGNMSQWAVWAAALVLLLVQPVPVSIFRTKTQGKMENASVAGMPVVLANLPNMLRDITPSQIKLLAVASGYYTSLNILWKILESLAVWAADVASVFALHI